MPKFKNSKTTKLVENTKIQKFKRDILSDFQTLCQGGGKFPVTVFVALITIVIYAITSYKLYKAKKKSDRILGLAKPLILPILKLSHVKSEQLRTKEVLIGKVQF